ncbi:co-chaperone GroES [Patescibacteria group bacterium]|nr:co-chaperone GroES [Patescibacteria group bacterium]
MAKTDKKIEKNKLNITPLGDRVVIKPLDGGNKEKRSAAGIIIPVAAQEDKADRGIVVAVGDGKIDDQGRLIPMKVKVGNKVLFQWGDKINIDDEEYYIVSESSILGIIK